ncbi:MAG: hypothetical protein HZA50_01300 [Planctomycetes bacterium]|nr:hypothetical protein [Planctomycetota bacterium]
MSAVSCEFDGVAEVKGPMDRQALAGIPAKRGLVLLESSGGLPVALLSAADIRSLVGGRLGQKPEGQSKRSADLSAVTAKIRWKLADSPFETDLEYLELAGRLWPGQVARHVAWKPAWFVHVDPRGELPRFAAERSAFDRPGRYIGPFIGRASADRFVQSVNDAFSLCRRASCLSGAASGRCAYGQMGKCLLVCDGGISIGDYGREVARAADFAAGNRQNLTVELKAAMKAHSGNRRFEQAAQVKARLECLGRLDQPEWQHARDYSDFRFISIQKAGRPSRRTAFICAGYSVRRAGPLDWPAQKMQLEQLLAEARAVNLPAGPPDEIGLLKLALVCRYLFMGAKSRGIFVRVGLETAADEFIAAVEQQTAKSDGDSVIM